MKRALVTLVVLSAAAIFVACGGPAVGKATGEGDWASDMVALRAESAAQGEANFKRFDKMMAAAAAERKAGDDANASAFDKKLAEADANNKADTTGSASKGMTKSEIEKAIQEGRAETEATNKAQLEAFEKRISDRDAAKEAEAAARDAAKEAEDAERDKADQQKAEEEKAEEEAKKDDKGDTDATASTDDGPSDAEYEAALLFIRDILNTRFPTYNPILNDENGVAEIKKWGLDPTSAESVISGIQLSAHEAGHGYNGSMARVTLDDGRGCDKFYLIDVLVKPYTTSWGNLEAGDWLDPTPCGLTYPNRTDYVPGISRSTILLDDQNYKRPPKGCTACILSPHDGEGEWGYDDLYSGMYLTDAPALGKITHYKDGYPGFDPSFTISANDSFDTGDQGYNMLFEETVQYVNSLSWAYSRHDLSAKSSTGSEKTAMLLWLWWNERYLKLTREHYPEEHEHWIKYYAEPFLWVWGKAWRHLDTPSMNYYEEKWNHLSELVTDDLMLGEIQYVRERYHGDAYKRGSELTTSTMSKDPDGITWDGPVLSGPPLIVDSGAEDGIYFATMPGGFTPVDEDRQGLADITEYIDKYNAQLSVADGGYGNEAWLEITD